MSIYPVLVIVTALTILFILLKVVVPKFVMIYRYGARILRATRIV